MMNCNNEVYYNFNMQMRLVFMKINLHEVVNKLYEKIEELSGMRTRSYYKIRYPKNALQNIYIIQN